MASYGFHPEAAEEYLAATTYYLAHASSLIAAAFVAEVESTIKTLLAAPTRFAETEEPNIRRCLLTRFPTRFTIVGMTRNIACRSTQ